MLEMSDGPLAANGAITPPAGGLSRFAVSSHPLPAQVIRFALVGGLGTAVNAAIFLVLRTWWDPMPANLVALVLSTAVSTEANRRFTFGGTMLHHWRAHVQSVGTVVFYAGYSSTVLLLVDALIENQTPVQETVAIVLASVLGGVCRFLLLRDWVFGPDDAVETPRPEEPNPT